jgi:S1-C subfamily serine protease
MSVRALFIACAVVAPALAPAGCGGSADEPPRVVRVTVAVDGLVPEFATGVVTGDGRVLTVAHALSRGHAVEAAGRPARVLRVDRRLDLALLAVPGLRARAVRFGGDDARLGRDDARSVAVAVLRDGRARALTGSIRRHVVIRWREQPGDRPLVRPGIELSARVDPGDSGAPVVDGRGRLLGVLYARSRDREGTAWAVDASAVRSVLAR